MIEDGRTWVVVADGRRARLLSEPKRGAPLSERWSMELAPEDRYEPADRAPRTFDRVGVGRHAADDGFDPHEEEERRFLKRVARRLDEEAGAAGPDFLVLFAAPRALGVLRADLSAALQGRVRHAEAKDIVAEPPARVRERLRDLRAET